MSDEFDDAFDAEVLRHHATALAPVAARAPNLAARLVSRMYTRASAPLRAAMLACLLGPLSPLGLVAVASGAFAGFLHRGGDRGPWVMLDDVGRFSTDQIFELARFVEQVSPDALQQVAGLVSENPVGTVAFSTSVALLLLRCVRGSPVSGPGMPSPGDAD
jgi:hypothetical protein